MSEEQRTSAVAPGSEEDGEQTLHERPMATSIRQTNRRASTHLRSSAHHRRYRRPPASRSILSSASSIHSHSLGGVLPIAVRPIDRSSLPPRERRNTLPARASRIGRRLHAGSGVTSVAEEEGTQSANGVGTINDEQGANGSPTGSVSDDDQIARRAENGDEMHILTQDVPCRKNTYNHSTDGYSCDDDQGTIYSDETFDESLYDVRLQEDVYSLLFAEFKSGAMYFALLVIALQMLIIILFVWDVLRDLNLMDFDNNPLNVPINVSAQARVAQFVALPLAVMIHADCTVALYYLRVQYEDCRAPITASKASWYLSLALRFFTGSTLVFASFLIVVQSTSIAGMFLNLGAITFIGELDNFMFWLAKAGFLKVELQNAAYGVSQVTFRAHVGTGRTVKRRLLLLITWAVLVACWSAIVHQQQSGFYLRLSACRSWSVQFSPSSEFTVDVSKIDFSDPMRSSSRSLFINETTSEPFEERISVPISFFSGTYRIGSSSEGGTLILNDRAVYYEDVSGSGDSQNDISVGKFHFCQPKEDRNGYWVFRVDALADGTHPKPSESDCDNWLMRSPPTTSYLLEDVISETWEEWRSNRVAMADSSSGFQMVCQDCSGDDGCNLKGRCNTRQRTCDCDPGMIGDTCDSGAPCYKLDMFHIGSSSYDFSSSGSFYLLREDSFGDDTASSGPILSSGHPTYIHARGYPNITSDLSSLFNGTVAATTASDNGAIADGNAAQLIVLFYSGGRWVESVMNVDTLRRHFTGRSDAAPTHAFWDRTIGPNVMLFTHPSLSRLPQDASLSWNRHRLGGDDNLGFFGASFSYEVTWRCADSKLKCGRYGTLVEGENVCDCSDCHGGPFCQYGPRDPYASAEFNSRLIGGEQLPATEYSSRYWQSQNLTECALSDIP